MNRAHDFCTAYPDANVLIVACEFCSLCYQPGDIGVGSLLSNGLFGDGIAAAVVRGNGGTGMRLERNGSYLIPHTEDWISYAVRSTGFHFQLDKRVPETMEPLSPALRALAEEHQWNVGKLDFYIVHAGGPRILDDLSRCLDIPPEAFRFSRATLTEYGNIASAVVLDALGRMFDEQSALERSPRPDSRFRSRHHRRDRAGHVGNGQGGLCCLIPSRGKQAGAGPAGHPVGRMPAGCPAAVPGHRGAVCSGRPGRSWEALPKWTRHELPPGRREVMARDINGAAVVDRRQRAPGPPAAGTMDGLCRPCLPLHVAVVSPAC